MFSRAIFKSARFRDKFAGMAVIAITFVLCLILSFWAKRHSAPVGAEEPAPPTKEGLAGYPNSVHPFELLERARQVTPRSHFQGMVAEGVRADGTMNFEEKGTRLRFAFQSPSGLGPQPVREGGTLPVRSYCGKQSVRVTEQGIYADPDVTDMPCSGKTLDALELPESCSLAQVWSFAKEHKKVDPTKVAKIEYYNTPKKGPAYRFFIKGKELFSLSARDCQKTLKSKDSRGLVP